MMKIRVLGCYGAEGIYTDSAGRETVCNTSGFLVNGSVMVDAGTITTSLDLSDLTRIKHVLLSHIHFDHIKGLPFLADNLFGKIDQPIHIHSIEEVLDGLNRHLLNDTVWPDFTRIPDPESPIFGYSELREEKEKQVENLSVTAIRVNHTVPTVGFLIQDADTAVLYSGDTCETQRIWEIASQQAKLTAVLIETSFPNDLHQVARDSGHLTPRMLGQEFLKIGRPDLPLYIYHMKPQYLKQLQQEIQALKIPNFSLLSDGQTLDLQRNPKP
jgi:ribonuclease BN (tRNA processing enzyme)